MRWDNFSGDSIILIVEVQEFSLFSYVINADSGDIVIRPRVQDMDLKRNLSFISKALAEDRSRRSGERCGFRDLGDWSCLGMDEFTEIDGMAVRKSYLPIAQM